MSGPHGQNHILFMGFGLIAGGLTLMSAWTAHATPIHQAQQIFNRLVASVEANDIDDIRSLCSVNYLHDHPPEFDEKGNLIGLPREPGPGVQARLRNGTVFFTAGDPSGPTYRFVLEGYEWKFDGIVEPDAKTSAGKLDAEDENDSDGPG